jgi:hypothetical protein
MNIVYAKEGAIVAHAGQRVMVRRGEPWDGDDALVKAHPELFVDGPASVRSTRDPSGVTDVPVERATQAPGEKRSTRKPRTSGGADKSGE